MDIDVSNVTLTIFCMNDVHSALTQYVLKSSKNVGLRCDDGRCGRYLSISSIERVLSTSAFITGIRKLYCSAQ